VLAQPAHSALILRRPASAGPRRTRAAARRHTPTHTVMVGLDPTIHEHRLAPVCMDPRIKLEGDGGARGVALRPSRLARARTSGWGRWVLA